MEPDLEKCLVFLKKSFAVAKYLSLGVFIGVEISSERRCWASNRKRFQTDFISDKLTHRERDLWVNVVGGKCENDVVDDVVGGKSENNSLFQSEIGEVTSTNHQRLEGGRSKYGLSKLESNAPKKRTGEVIARSNNKIAKHLRGVSQDDRDSAERVDCVNEVCDDADEEPDNGVDVNDADGDGNDKYAISNDNAADSNGSIADENSSDADGEALEPEDEDSSYNNHIDEAAPDDFVILDDEGLVMFSSDNDDVKKVEFEEYYEDSNVESGLDSTKSRHRSLSKSRFQTHIHRKCRVCGLEFPTRDERLKHFEKVHLKCNFCGVRFKEAVKLKNHIDVKHNDLKPFSCTVCDERFKNRNGRQRHMKSIHGIKSEDVGSVPCHICEMPFDSKAERAKHVREEHLRCGECGKCFSQGKSLRAHMNTAHGDIKVRPYACDLCDKSYTQSAALSMHKKLKHEGKKDFVCSDCGKAFVAQSLLNNHVKRIHARVRNHACDLCPATFFLPGGLQRHVSAVHEGKKSVVCKECGKAFSEYSGLRLHMMGVHMEKKFACSLCPKKFPHKSKLLQHEETHRKRKCCSMYHVKSCGNHHSESEDLDGESCESEKTDDASAKINGVLDELTIGVSSP